MAVSEEISKILENDSIESEDRDMIKNLLDVVIERSKNDDTEKNIYAAMERIFDTDWKDLKIGKI